jgi:hypothetical protein
MACPIFFRSEGLKKISQARAKQRKNPPIVQFDTEDLLLLLQYFVQPTESKFFMESTLMKSLSGRETSCLTSLPDFTAWTLLHTHRWIGK